MDIERRRLEYRMLQELAERSQSLLSVTGSADLSTIICRLDGIPGPVGSRGEALEIVREHELRITLPPDYPDIKPLFAFARPIFHPNCWSSGTFCYGEHYYPGMHLTELLIAVVHDIELWGPDPFYLDSSASLTAHNYYRNPEWVRQLRARLRAIPFPPANPTIRVVALESKPPASAIRVVRR